MGAVDGLKAAWWRISTGVVDCGVALRNKSSLMKKDNLYNTSNVELDNKIIHSKIREN